MRSTRILWRTPFIVNSVKSSSGCFTSESNALALTASSSRSLASRAAFRFLRLFWHDNQSIIRFTQLVCLVQRRIDKLVYTAKIGVTRHTVFMWKGSIPACFADSVNLTMFLKSVQAVGISARWLLWALLGLLLAEPEGLLST